MSVKDDLIAARALIDTPEKWQQAPRGMGRRNPHTHNIVESLILATAGAPYAAFPLVDALCAALPERFAGDDEHALHWFEAANATTHADVMALFDRAIEAAE
jgi:hypothetical protein